MTRTIPLVDLYAQYISLKEEIDIAISETIRSSQFVRGAEVEKFEVDFAKAVGADYCISCGNGTDALYIAIKAMGLKAGDEVITTAHSWISTAETITQAGGRVVFCDIDPVTGNIDTAQMANLVTSRTVGVIPVHLYGHPADMLTVMSVAEKFHLWVIEDCAQAHLASFGGRKVGTFGVAGTFSFYPGKNLGAMGDAGAIVTSDVRLAEWCTLFARHGGKGVHAIEGINSRLDTIQAAILNVKLPHLARWNARRFEIAVKYASLLGGIPELSIPHFDATSEQVFHLFVVRTAHRDLLSEFLKTRGVVSSVNYPESLPFLPAYQYLGHTKDDFPEAWTHQHKILSLPIYPEMTDGEIDYIAMLVDEFLSTVASRT